MTRILVIEDDTQVCHVIHDLLKQEGYDVATATTGQEGIQHAHSYLPDLIICDIVMPGVTGFDVLHTLRRDKAVQTVPFIFLTGLTDRAERRRGMAQGADDYLTKPFTSIELLQTVAARLARQAAMVAKVQQRIEALHQSIATTLPHELRTPLTSILGGSELLCDCLQDTLNPEELLTIAQIIRHGAERLNRLVINYLLYTELELAVRDATQRARYRQNALGTVQQTIRTLTQLIAQQEGRSQDLHLDLQDSEVQIAEPHLCKIVEELVHNAFKFSPEGTPVSVETFLSGDQFWLVVHDQGCGMHAEHIAALEIYRQFDRLHQEQQGMGLGFTLARRLVELYGGAIHVTSMPGEQTTVTVSLPIAPLMPV